MNDPEAPEGEADATDLTIDQAAAAYAKSQLASQAAEEGQADDDEISEEADGETAEDDQDDVEGDTADEGQADDEAADGEPESESGRFVADNAKVRLADGTVTTIAELKEGSLRDADYRRKTMEVAEQRRSFQDQSERLKQHETQLAQKLDQVEAFLGHFQPQQPDPSLVDPASPNYDPAKYLHQEAQRKQLNEWMSFVQQERQRATETRQAETAKEVQDRQNRESALLVEKMPELRDEKRAKAFAGDIQQVLPKYGFTQQEIANLPIDHRQFLVLRDAIRWSKLQASKAAQPKSQVPRPPVQKGGKRLTPDAHKARSASAAIDRARQSGSLEDVTAAYLATQKG
jgi:hypothetical protein